MKKDIAFALFTLIICISCSRVAERDFFRFPMTNIEADCPLESLLIGEDTLSGVMTADCIVRDSIIIATSRTDHLFSISGIGGELIGEYCRRGRAGNELLSALPLTETYINGTDIYADIYSPMDTKLFVWNISKSLSENRDVYESIIRFESKEKATLQPWMSLYRTDANHIIVYNSMQSGYSDGLVGVPDYQVYDLESGTLQRQYGLFNAVKKETENQLLSPSTFLTNVDCIKPDRTRLVFGMYFMPVFCILDIKSGEARAYRLKGHDGIDLQKPHRHFVDIQANDDCIYALYSGEEMFKEDGTDVPDQLYVMDWNGHLLCRYSMDRRFSGLSLDGEKLYLTHYNGAAAVVNTDTLKAGRRSGFCFRLRQKRKQCYEQPFRSKC